MCSGDAAEERLAPRWRGAVGAVEGWRGGGAAGAAVECACRRDRYTYLLQRKPLLNYSTFPRGVSRTPLR